MKGEGGGVIVMSCSKGVFSLGYIPQAGRGAENSGRNQGTLQAIFSLSSETKYTTGLKLKQKLSQRALRARNSLLSTISTVTAKKWMI